MIAQAVGHGGVVTGVIFLPDCKHIVSVGGDGCIFVWKLPLRLASRMLQKTKENSFLLSPKTLYMPVALNQTISCGEGNKSCRIDSKVSMLAERSGQLDQRANYHGWDSPETYSFKLSISRLPKWAQDKVAGSDFVQKNLEFASPQLMQVEPKASSPLIRSGGPLCHEHQTPSGCLSGGSNLCHSSLCKNSSNGTNNTQSSGSPDKLVSTSAAKDHWFTVYNVRLDLLNSPEVQNPNDIHMPVSSPKLVQCLAEMPNESEHSLSQRDSFVDEGKTATSEHTCLSSFAFLSKNQNNLLAMESTKVNHKAVPDVIKQLYSDKTEQSAMDVCAFHMKSEESDLFKDYFGNLSAMLKVEKRQSRRYSSQYFVRRDYLVGYKSLFNPSNQKNESAATNVTLEEVAGSSDQDLNSTKCLLNRSIEEGSSTIEEEPEAPKPKVDEESEVREKITAGKEALISLDIAADNVLQLFTKLGTECSMEDASNGSGAQLYDEAIELLPKIVEKINAISKVVQSNSSHWRSQIID